MNTNGTVKPPRSGGLIKRLLALPAHAMDYIKGKSSNLLLSSEMAEQGSDMVIDRILLNQLHHHLEILLESSSLHQPDQATAQELLLIQDIITTTNRLNRNNVTRTIAYYDIYQRHPELHWALLAHMVSRNGGWNMTDLRGEWLPILIAKDRCEDMFEFLERINALIFQDAYPQLLLYEAGRAQKRNLSHLLPSLHVSAFMKPIWDLFWHKRCSELLTVGLIVNEQHYIEGRVVQKEPYRSLLDSLALKAQALFQLNIIVFPYSQDHLQSHRLAGVILESFSDLSERIGIGKKLYAILFGVPAIHEGVLTFASVSPHTGSRSDYWPQLFATIKKAPPGTNLTEKLDGCKLVAGADRLYSPKLANAWKDRQLEPSDRYDWFSDMKAMDYFSDIALPRSFEITNEYCFALNKLELAALASQKFT